MKEQSKQNEQFSQTPVSGSRYVPMLFSTEMVEAILNGTKTETRRIVKFPSDFEGKVYNNGIYGLKYSSILFDGNLKRLFPKIEFGDIIWVRETFRPIEQEIGKPRYEYKASEKVNLKDKWKPSLFMPKDACRIFLKCVSARAERLQDIDEKSAINEGIEDMLLNVDTPATAYRNYMATYKDLQKDHWSHVANDAVESYMTLWQKINGKESWEKNPFVWVYKFEVIKCPHDFR